MNNKHIAAAFFAAIASATLAIAQNGGKPLASPTPARTPVPAQTPRLSDALSQNVASLDGSQTVSRERREQAFAKLLEGQRYVWLIKRSRAQATANGRLARQAFQKAVELDPTLAEGYTALAELAWNLPPNDLEEAVRLADIAIKIDKNNFGAHRILARGFTIKSRLNRGDLDKEFVAKAIAAWKEIARLDPRNAEAWAFLSELQKDNADERIRALRNWLSSAPPVDAYFYRTLMGGQADLAPEAASARLAEALVDAKRFNEAIEVLNQVIADDPENGEAVELLSRALDSADPAAAATSIQAIRQAIYATPGNTQLILLLAKVQSKAGRSEETAKFLNDTVARLAEQDKAAAAGILVGLAEVYRDGEQFDAAIAAYYKSLETRGIAGDKPAVDEERDFAIVVYEGIIGTLKIANRFAEARDTIIASQKVLGDEDSFTDRQLINLYREDGKKQEALQATKAARVRFPQDYGFLRTEAMLLTELGRVDEGVAIIKSLLGKQNPEAPSIMYDDFSNQLFIAILFGEAKRGKDAVSWANQALAKAADEERRQIALLTLATGQQVSGDFAAAEATLRGILKQTPRNPIALNNLGYFLLERNERLDEALKLIEQALEIDPRNASYLDSLGWAYFKLGKLELAEENLKKALKIDSTSATVLEHLGDVYAKQGKTDLARQMWQRALAFASEAGQINDLRQKIAGKKTGR